MNIYSMVSHAPEMVVSMYFYLLSLFLMHRNIFEIKIKNFHGAVQVMKRWRDRFQSNFV